jgi:hypothetical protein
LGTKEKGWWWTMFVSVDAESVEEGSEEEMSWYEM